MKKCTKFWTRALALMVLTLVTSLTVVAQSARPVAVKSSTNGTVTVDKATAVAGETVTITVTPATGYYAESSDVTIELTIDPGSANAPHREPSTSPTIGGMFHPDGNAVACATEPGTYTFVMPEYPYGVEISTEFHECIEITAGMFNDIPEQDWTGSQITPVPEISSAGTGAGLTTDYYTLAYGENVNPNPYNYDGSVTVTGKGKFKGTVTLHFEIYRSPLYLTGSICDWSTDHIKAYTFEEQANGTYKIVLNEEWPNGTEFKCFTKKGDVVTWYGGNGDGSYWINKDMIGVAQDLTIPGVNFHMTNAGKWTIIVSADWKTITITGDWKYSVELHAVPTEGGTVTASSERATEGSIISLEVTPAEGYELTSLTVTNKTTQEAISLNENNEFSMPASDVEVWAHFEKIPTLTLVYSVDDWGHQYKRNFTKDAEGNFSLNVTGWPSNVQFYLLNEDNEKRLANPGNGVFNKDMLGVAQSLKSEFANGENFVLPVPGDWEFYVPANRLSMIVNGTWKYKVNTYVYDETGGTVTATPQYADPGAIITLTVTPDEGYQMDHLTVVTVGDTPASVDFTDNGDGTFTFTMPDSDVDARVKFVKTPKLTLVRTSNAADDWSSIESIPFTKNENGVWVLPEQTWEAGVAFYLQDENGTKYYYAQSSEENEYYNMPKDKVGQWQNLYTGTPRGQYFKMPVAGKWTITVNEARIALKVEGDWGHLITINADESLNAHTEVVHALTDTYVEDNYAAENERVKVVYTPIGDVNTVEVKDADGNTVAYDTEDNSFLMPDSPVTITITYSYEYYAVIMTQATGEQGYYLEANVENVAKVRPGTTVTVTVTPNSDSDFVVVGLVTDPALEVTDNGDGTYTFTMPRQNVRVSATLEAKLQGVEFTADRHWATYVGKYTLQKPENVSVYEVTGISGNLVQVEELDYIPDYYPVLLYSETPMSNITTPVIANQDESTAASPLLGSVDGTNVQAGDYVLYNDVFIRSEAGSLAAHRCYIPGQAINSSNAAGAPRMLTIALPDQGGIITAIEDIDASDVASVKYVNMQGVTSDKPFSGVNIKVVTRTDGTTVTSKVVK